MNTHYVGSNDLDSAEAPLSMGQNSALQGIRRAVDDQPTFGCPVEIAPDLFWIRLPLTSGLDHVNVYALRDGDGWVLVDTGTNTAGCKDALEHAFRTDSLRCGHGIGAISKLIVTHYHSDHIGLANYLDSKGATLYTTQVCWLCSSMLWLDQRTEPNHAEMDFMRRAGLTGLEWAAFLRRAPHQYSALVGPIPSAYRRLESNQRIKIGERYWTIHIGHGHASHHATLWSDDGIAITGDQILCGTASNLSVPPSEPDADLVTKWLASCETMKSLATEATLCLPGHNAPFRGIPTRCDQLIASQHSALVRLHDALDRPKSAVDALDAVYRRKLAAGERGPLIAETMGFLNHLAARGLIQREPVANGADLWWRTNKNKYELSSANVPANPETNNSNRATDTSSSRDI